MRKERVIGPILFILLWYLVYYLNIINKLFLPTPHEVFISMGKSIATPIFWFDIGETLWRTFIGFSISLLIGVPIGLLMGYYEKVNSSFELLVDFFRSLPALAIFPLLMFFFGIGNTSKIATAVFSCTFIIIINTIYGVIHSTKSRQITGLLMGATKWEIFRKIIFMDALPHIFVGIRTSISMALIVIVVTEMFIGTDNGIGYRIFETQQSYKVNELYAYILVAGLLGYFLNQGVIKVEKNVAHWSGK
jgi:ABC-type nitrate/sulfonate/bicarbonate transport system permease component